MPNATAIQRHVVTPRELVSRPRRNQLNPEASAMSDIKEEEAASGSNRTITSPATTWIRGRLSRSRSFSSSATPLRGSLRYNNLRPGLAERSANAGLCGEKIWLTILEEFNDDFEHTVKRLVGLPEDTKVYDQLVGHLCLVISHRAWNNVDPDFCVNSKYWTKHRLSILGFNFYEIQCNDAMPVDFDTQIAKRFGVAAKKLAVGPIPECSPGLQSYLTTHQHIRLASND
ncbi:hypothetical protein FPHYL_4894 [Fusarium phyllophilum]|uniref:Uncharacterized protein n=1 Tax=Fusarium phyllophilum TaxID=47803 RepID=A0A8H5JY29_9HYPO|nr:hypothetical protein FPHYL_4894 [Fusarium phyllophilum]